MRPSRGRAGRPPRRRRSTEWCTSETGASVPAAASRWRLSRPTATILSGSQPAAERSAAAGVTTQLARWIATIGGLGYLPVAPGTAASLPVALAVWWLQPSDFVLLAMTL